MSTVIASEILRARLLESLAYQASAARLNVDEPAGYGPYRLLEGCVRTIRAMRDLGLGDAELERWAHRTAIDAMVLISDQAQLGERAEALLAEVVERLGGPAIQIPTAATARRSEAEEAS